MEGLNPRLRDGGDRYPNNDDTRLGDSLDSRTGDNGIGRLPTLTGAIGQQQQQQHGEAQPHSQGPMSARAATAQNVGWRPDLSLGQQVQQHRSVQQGDQQPIPSPPNGSGFTPANPPPSKLLAHHSNADTGTPQSGNFSYYNNSNHGDSRSPSADNENTPTPDGAAGVAGESVDPVGSSSKRGACMHCSHSKVRFKERVRKRTKKSEDKVAELERKVELLMNQLHNRNATASWDALDGQSGLSPAAQQPAQHSPVAQDASYRPTSDGLPPLPMALAGQRRLKRKFSPSAESAHKEVREIIAQTFQPPPTPVAGRTDKTNDLFDPVDRGILSMDQANQLFTRYTDEMAAHLPGVIFPAGTTAAQVRKTKPVLFLALMATSSFDLPTIQPTLTEHLMQTIANKVVVGGQKSLELIQALQVAVMWYWPPEHFERLNFYQLIHMAAVMSLDLGLDQPKARVSGIKKQLRQHIIQNHPGMFQVDPSSVECRRAWLTAYFLAMNASMALRRRCLIRWDTHMDKCVEVLRTSPEAAPSDAYLCHLVLTHKLAEEIGIQFKIADAYSSIDVNDEMAYAHLRGFEWELDRYRAEVAGENMRPSLRLSYHVINLYMHEAVAQPDLIEEPQQQPYAAENLTGAHISAILACQVAIDGIIDVFLSMDVDSIRCLPVFNFVRITFAVVVLIKIYSAASTPNSKLRGAIDAKHMDVTKRLDALLEKFRLAAAKDQSRPANKFLIVLLMFRTWFQQQQQELGAPGVDKRSLVKGDNGSTPSQTTRPQQQPQQQPSQQQVGYSTATAKNTPLQVLSEVAVNQNGTTPNNNTNIPASQQQQQQQQQQPQQTPAPPYMMDWTAPNNHPTYSDYPSSTSLNAEPLQPNLWPQLDLVFPGGDYGFFGGDPFGQALDLTYGNLGFSGWDGLNAAQPPQMAPPQQGYTDAAGQVSQQVPPQNNGYLSAVLNDMDPGTAGNQSEAGGGGYQ
ncbi:hypothetical protein DL546_002312 [Coniochaeta pulveracea]|uniref:Transcription factor domain-containing protein n=1 Tax=Coniochaeta pulveracea TaxID=177199 RepID=A0A420Y1M2_9PEZI|nr:hypothetical protein DL546_002312 [Coniochaeta pulveracea]